VNAKLDAPKRRRQPGLGELVATHGWANSWRRRVMSAMPERPVVHFRLGELWRGQYVTDDQEVRMEGVQRPDAPESKSDASASGPGIAPMEVRLPSGMHEQIARRAYELAAQRGFAPGHELDDWLQAEAEIEAGAPRNTPPDNPFDDVKTFSNE
jgi:DUF2934 family protein